MPLRTLDSAAHQKTSKKSFTREHLFLEFNSPVGMLTVVRNEVGICRILWCNEHRALGELKDNSQNEASDRILNVAQQQMSEYFEGKRQTFELNLAPEGTEFQKNVWLELAKIPYGKTISYGEQAARLGDSKKARAVGAANGKNPLSIVVPCHRVVGTNGALTGFAGGIEAKKLLLDLEKQFSK